MKGKTIILGVSGGIAAYKAASICSALTQKGARVHVIMTASATKFIAPLTFQTLSRQPVVIDTFDEKDASVVSHIHLADLADLVVIAPATANFLAKMANGLADDMLSTTLLATQAPILVAPAMNVHMYDHPSVVENIETLRRRGVKFIEPDEGQLACGYVGKGRLAEPEEIVAEIERFFFEKLSLKGKRILVTAGATREVLDPVRYFTNRSTGKMGVAVANEALKMGADVTLVAGPAVTGWLDGVRVTPIISAKEMLEAVMKECASHDALIMAAAVADYRPAQVFTEKIKKQPGPLTLTLERTEDVLANVAQLAERPLVVGFAAETNDVEENALSKLKRKKLDFIVANDISREGAGFGVDTNIVTIYDKNGLVESLPLMKKEQVAAKLLAIVGNQLVKTPEHPNELC